MPSISHHNSSTRPAAIALILGSLLGILTMAVHPVASSAALTLASAQHLAGLSAIAHAHALLGTLLLFLGASGLTVHLSRTDTPDPTPFAALTTFAFASVAILTAAMVSGFIVPRMLLTMLHDDPAYLPQWHIVNSAIFQFNQAFAQLYSIATSLSISLWSVSVLRHRTLPRWLALYGCIAAPALLILVAIGHLRLNVHGMATVVFVQAVWFLAAGLHLLRQPGGKL